MKPTVFLLCLALTVMGCSNDDDANQNDNPQQSLKGSWTMVNIFGGFAGIDDDYEPGEIVWAFDEETNTLTVDNSVENDETIIASGFDSGTYDYHTETEEESDYLFVEASKFGEYYFNADTLVVDSNVGADGFRFKLQAYSGGD